MNKKVLYSIIGIVVLLAVVAGGVYAYQQMDKDTDSNSNTSDVSSDNTDSENSGEDDAVSNTSYESEKGTAITVTTPTRGGQVTSPLKVAGSVPGTWSNEGEFTVRLLDSNSGILAEGSATLDGDWMSENQVNFTAELTFDAPEAGGPGLLVLAKANPSGLQDNADSLTVPVRF